MDSLNLTLGISNVFIGLLCIALALPLVMGKVGMNRWYGVRVPRSYRSERHWYLINRYGGLRLIVWSLPIMASGIVAFFLPLRDNPTLTVVVALVPLLVLVAAVESLLYARRLPESLADRQASPSSRR